MTSLPPRLFSGATISTVGRIIGTGCSILTVAVVIRALARTAEMDGLALYGAYATILAYVTLVTIIGDGGFYLMFTREASREGASEEDILNIAWRLRLLGIVLICVSASLLVLFLPYPPIIRTGVLLGMWGGASQLGSQLFLGVFQKRLRLLTPAIAEVVGRAVQLLGVLVIAWWSPSILGFIAAFVAGTFATFLWNIIGVRRLVRFRLLGVAHAKAMRAFLREAWPLGLSLILSHLFFKIDSVILSLLRPAADVALYALPYKVLESLLFFPAMVGGMLLPVFSRASTKEARGVADPLRAAVDLYALCAFPLVGLLILTAPALVTLLGGTDFAPSARVLQILAVALGVLAFGNLYGNAVIAVGRQRDLVWMYAALTIINILANLVAIPRWSYLGAAWTTLGTEFLSVLFAALILLRQGVAVVGTRRTGRLILGGLFFAMLLLLPIPLLLRCLLAVTGYVIVLTLLGVVRLEDLRRYSPFTVRP